MKLKAKILQIPDGLQWVGVRFFIQQSTPVYKKFQCYMRSGDNKTLFQIIL